MKTADVRPRQAMRTGVAEHENARGPALAPRPRPGDRGLRFLNAR